MSELNEVSSAAERQVDVENVGESEIYLYNQSILRAYLGEAFTFFDGVVLVARDTIQGSQSMDITIPTLENLIQSAHQMLGGLSLEVAMRPGLSEPDCYGMYTQCRSRLREINDMVHIMNDRYDAGLYTIDFSLIDNIAEAWAGRIEFQSGENDYDDGAILNHKKVQKNKYARKQYRRKMAVRAEEQKVFSIVADFEHTRKEKEQKREMLLRSKDRNIHTQNLIPVHQELRRTILYSKEIKALKDQEKKARSCLNAKRHGRVRNAYEEKVWQAELRRQHELDRVNAERALQYLEFVERFRHIELNPSKVYEVEQSRNVDDRVPNLKVYVDDFVEEHEQKTRSLSTENLTFQAGESKNEYVSIEDKVYHVNDKIHISVVFRLLMRALTKVGLSAAYGYYGAQWSIRMIQRATIGERFNLDRSLEDSARRWGLLPVINVDALVDGHNPPVEQDNTSKIVAHAIEKAVLFMTALLKAETFSQQTTIFLLFVSCHMKNGIASSVMDVVNQILRNLNIEFQTGVVDDLKDKWNKIKDSKSAGKMVEIISFVVATIMSSLFGYENSKFDYKKYMSLTRPKKEGTLLECVIDDALFFLDKGLLFFRTGSFRALFVDEVVAKEYDNEFAFIAGNFHNVETDSMEASCGISMATYLTRLEQNHADTKKMADAISKHSERRFLTERLVKLTKMLDSTRKIVQGRNARIKPYGLMIDGRSGVGKTTFKSMIIKHIMLSNPGHFSGDARTICTMNGDDPYQTELTNGHGVVVLDDLGQTNPPYAKSNPCQLLINILNNEPKAVLKADVDSKGKVYYNCNLVVVTTNVSHLHSDTYSVEPAAVMRRLEVVIEVHVKQQYRVDGGVSIDKTKVNSLFTDLWEFRVYYHVPDENGRGFQRNAVFEGQELTSCSFVTLCRFLQHDTRLHFRKQAHLLNEQKEVNDMKLCEHGILDKMCDQCPREVPEIGALKAIEYAYQAYEDQQTITNIVWKNGIVCGIYMFLVWSFFVVQQPAFYLTFVAINLVILLFFSLKVFSDWRHTRCERGFSMKHFCKEKERKVIWTGIALISVPLIYCTLRSIRKMAKLGSLVPQGASLTVPAGTETPIESCWTKPMPKKNDIDQRLATMTVEQGLGLLRQKLSYAEFDTNQYSDVFPVMSNIWMVNWHTVAKKPTKIRVFVQGEHAVGPNFECSLSEINYRRIGKTDFALMYLPKGGSQMNLLHMFPKDHGGRSGRARFIHKKKDGTCFEESVFADYGELKVYVSEDFSTEGYGYKYDLSDVTFKGMCMSCLVSEGKNPEILGFHFAGDTKALTTGTAQRITQRDVSQCLSQMYDGWDNPICETASAGKPKLDFPDHGVFQNGKIHPKSPVLYLEKGSLKVYGDHTGHLTSYRSKIVNTKIADTVAEVCNKPILFGPPKNIGTYKPKFAELEKITDTKELPWDALQWAMRDFHGSVQRKLKGRDHLKKRICKLSNDVNLAGLDGIRGIDAINLASSMGHPINKPKTFFVREKIEPVPGITRPLEVDQSYWDEVSAMEATLSRGERIYTIAKAHLKDEAKKLESEKVRVFYGTQFCFLLLLRRYFLTLCKFYMDHPEIFETTVGMNVYGPEWNDLAHKLTRQNFERLVAGDFASYDSFMSAQVILSVGKGFVMLAEWSGMFDDEDIIIMKGIFTEIANPLMDFFGTYIEVMGCNTSGHSMTIIVNDWGQKLYDRVAAYIATDGKIQVPFEKAVFLRTNGDDNVMSVTIGYDEINHTSLQAAFASCGITYTMPNKTDESKPFCKLEEVDYLKRKFRWDISQQRYHPALEKNSIFKMLQVYEPSSIMSDDELCATNINTALQEMYYHGVDEFFILREQLEIVVDRHDLRPWFKGYQLRSYDECLKFDLEQFNQGTQLPVIFCDAVEFQNGNLNAVKIKGSDVDWSIIKNRYSCIGYQSEQSILSLSGLGLQEFWSFPRETPLFRGAFQRTESICHDVCNPIVIGENNWIPSFTNTTNGFVDVTNNVNQSSNRDEHQTTTFRDGITQWISAIPNIFDRTRDVGMSQDAPVEKFFERPLLVRTYEWNPSALPKFYETFNPWTLYFGNARIVNRINNYALMRAKLKVKFVINGNSFYYGRLMADYVIRPTEDDVTMYGTGTTLNGLVGASQRLHLMLDPTESQGGILCLPFIDEYNNMRVPNSDWDKQGIVCIREMSKLKHANGSVNPITINVYVWAEDVKLSIPTKESCNSLVAQTGTVVFQSGEYGSSPISNMMSTVAEIAGKLVQAPMIGPYAKATQLVSTGVGSMAKLFGFSRPLQIENRTIVQRVFTGPMCTTDQGDPSMKLTVDSKQELSIDPRIMGISPVDEMTVNYIASRESWFAQFVWTTLAAPNALLFNVWVTPNVINAVGQYRYATASAFACMPFTFWRGTMIYRFSIVASAYHRGRLLFVYAPRQQVGAGDTLTQYSKIVDLSNERDFTMEIGWASHKSFLRVGNPNNATPWSATALGSPGDLGNGTLSVFVLNELTTPSDAVNNDITINVFVKAADDFSAAVPNTNIALVTYLNADVPQSGYVDFQAGETEFISSEESNAPVKEDIEECAAPCLEVDNTYDVYMGEKVTSLRQLLKRYVLHTSYRIEPSASNQIRIIEFDFPIFRGVGSGGRFGTTTAANVVTTTMMNYMAPAYVGYRGSIRIKLLNTTLDSGVNGLITVSRLIESAATPYSKVTMPINYTSDIGLTESVNSSVATLLSGGEIASTSISGSIEVELPYQRDTRFTWTRRIRSIINTSLGIGSHTIAVRMNNTTATAIDKYVSVGEDFQFFLFQGQPPFKWGTTVAAV